MKTRSFLSVLFVVFLDNFALALVYPIFSTLMLNQQSGFLPSDLSLSTRTIYLSFLIASFPLTQFFGATFFGKLSDKKGRKNTFYLTLIGEAIGFFLSGFAASISSYYLLVFARMFTGFFAGNLTICLASVSDMSKTDTARRKNFGMVGALTGISFIIAILAGGNLSNRALNADFSASVPFYFTGIICLINLALIFYGYTELKKHSKIKYPSIFHILPDLRKRGLHLFYLTFLFFMYGWLSILQYLSAFLIEHYHLSKFYLTLSFSILGVMWFICSNYINGFLIHRFFPRTIFRFCLFMIIPLAYLIALAPPYPVFISLLALLAAFAGITWVNLMAEISFTAPNAMQGQILGINQSTITLASLIAPIVGATIAYRGTQSIYLLAASAFLATVFILKDGKNHTKLTKQKK